MEVCYVCVFAILYCTDVDIREKLLMIKIHRHTLISVRPSVIIEATALNSCTKNNYSHFKVPLPDLDLNLEE